MDDEAFISGNNRRFRKGPWCVAVTIVLLITVIISAIAAIFITMMYDADRIYTNTTLEFLDENSTDYVPWQIYHGKWDLVMSENMEPYLAELGIPWIVRQMADKVPLYLLYKVNGNHVKIQAVNAFMADDECEYFVNGPPTIITLLSRKHQANTTWEDGKLVVQISGSAEGDVKPQKITRTCNGDEMHQTMEIGEAVAKTHYVRAKQEKRQRVF